MPNLFEDIETLEITIDDVCNTVKSNFPRANIGKIRKAYELSNEVHKSQLRKTGEPYIIHPLFVSYLVATLRLDETAVIAALLHDTVEDTPLTLEEIKNTFGQEESFLVDGLTNIRQVSKNVNILSSDFESSRKLLITSTKDIRVIIIKLADRLHNVLTIKGLSAKRQKEYALETLKLYAPLADFVGIYIFRKKLEDYSFKNLESRIYLEIKNYLINNKVISDGNEISGEDYMQKQIDKLNNLLKDNKIKSEVFGRHKGVYSIYRKIMRRYKEYNIKYIKDVNDLIGITILTNSIPECYRILGIVHSKYNNRIDLFDDYIAKPKSNGYRAIHTCLLDSNNVKIALQIKTFKMHEYNEFGPASHIYYKQKDSNMPYGYNFIVNQVSLLKKLVKWKNPIPNVENYKVDVFKDKVFVLTPQKEVKELDKGSTALDFAYLIHTRVGNACKGVKINGQMKSLDYVLSTGDVVEVLVDKRKKKPSVDWLSFVQTAYAKSNIKKALKEENPKIEEEEDDFEEERIEQIEKPTPVGKEKDTKDVPILRIKDIDNLDYSLAKCCSPIPGDDIIAHVTKTRGVKIHRSDCVDLKNLDYKVLLEAEWISAKVNFNAALFIQGNKDNSTFVQSLTKLLTDLKIELEKIDILNKDLFNCKIIVSVSSKDELDNLIRKIKRIKYVSNVQRVNLD